jgi:hypothetical protein
MGVHQNTMWQQAPPPQTSSTNPFAAPSGQSVRDCTLIFFLFSTKFFVAYTYLSSIFFLSLSVFLSSCSSNTNTFNPLFFFLSLSSLSTNWLTIIYWHSPTFFFRFTIIAKNTYFSRQKNIPSCSSIFLSLFAASFLCTCAL